MPRASTGPAPTPGAAIVTGAPDARPDAHLDGPPDRHTVVAGDTLWGLAAAELRRNGIAPTAARTSARWPAWWTANRAEVGPDPDLLHPGQQLHPPRVPPAS